MRNIVDNNIKHEYTYQYIKADSVEFYKDNSEPLWDIEIEDNHSFVLATGGGVVVHNSLKQGRDRHTQAVLPLRGKVLNTEKSTIDKILDNKELVAITTAIGTGFGDSFDISKLRYHKIIIACDADCLEENTQVVTESSIKKIKDVTADDKVLTHDGSYKQIINVTNKSFDEVIEIDVNGTIIACSLEHKWPVLRDGNVTIVKAKNLRKTDFFLFKNN
ncbi:hypothetical protein CMI47_13235 [Candidatus Pacearchaeota archaeon]|nr:hypothetical protein [Candidatus Pacearchaeota archaeon]|tara:strand:- start:54 stop:707 length:654 start_codon:yes stop_codon:yes gene_type:complete